MSHEELTGSQAHELIEETVKISKTSVIDCLNRLVGEKLATYREESGRGGARRHYKLTDRTWSSFHSSIVDKFLFKLWEIFPDCKRIEEMIQL